MNALVPSAPAEIDLETQKLVAELDNAARKRAWGVKVSKLVGYDRNGLPDYPQVTLEAGVGAYGQPVASVKVQQTRTNSSDFAGTLRDLDVRTAVEYYTRLNSADAIDAVEKVMSLIDGHFKMGGTLVNINVVDAAKILEAHKDPSKYPDLVVRVTGFTAYFNSLSPDFRQLVVKRLIREAV